MSSFRTLPLVPKTTVRKSKISIEDFHWRTEFEEFLPGYYNYSKEFEEFHRRFS